MDCLKVVVDYTLTEILPVSIKSNTIILNVAKSNVSIVEEPIAIKVNKHTNE